MKTLTLTSLGFVVLLNFINHYFIQSNLRYVAAEGSVPGLKRVKPSKCGRKSTSGECA